MRVASCSIISVSIALTAPSVLVAQSQVSKGVAARAMIATGDWSVSYALTSGQTMWIDRSSRIEMEDGIFRINFRLSAYSPQIRRNLSDHQQAETWSVNCRTAEYKHIGWYANNGVVRTRDKIIGGANWRELDRRSVVYIEACSPPTRTTPISETSTPAQKCIELGFAQGTDEFNQCVIMISE